MVEDELYNEWASGVQLANSEYFQEIPLELNKPENFTVTPEQVPDSPTEVKPQVAVEEGVSSTVVETHSAAPESDSETIELEGGGKVIIEKTGRGWKAVLESGIKNIASENFYGNNKTQLIANLAKGKLEASKTIVRLKKERLLGADKEPSTPVQVPTLPSTTTTVLTADDVAEIKNALVDNPSNAFDLWLKKRFGMDPDKFVQALNAAEEARSIVNAQTVKADIEAVNKEFIRDNPDFAQDYSTDPENVRKLIARMAKAYLNKKITPNSPQAAIDTAIYDLYSKGYWTVENLETAKEELVESGLLESTHQPEPPKPKPQPVAQESPSAPAAPPIAPQTGPKTGISVLGMTGKETSPPTITEKPLSDVDLQKMDMKDLRLIAQAQLKAMKEGR